MTYYLSFRVSADKSSNFYSINNCYATNFFSSDIVELTINHSKHIIMEEKKEVTHSLHLEQRGHGLITGVTEMKSFDEENIFMETSQGTLAIRGSSLHVCRLELEKGEAEIEGKVDSLIYTQGRKEKKKGSLLKRLFQ